jgi:hypothetical protein
VIIDSVELSHSNKVVLASEKPKKMMKKVKVNLILDFMSGEEVYSALQSLD